MIEHKGGLMNPHILNFLYPKNERTTDLWRLAGMVLGLGGCVFFWWWTVKILFAVG